LIFTIAQFLFGSGCKKEEIPTATLTTSVITNITGTSASSGGNITDDGGSTVTVRGVCWSTGITPTIADNKTTDGAGAGTFTSNMPELKGGTAYYVRAYATNSAGTGYGMAMSFKTLGQEPLATTQAATNVTATSATLNGTINANYLSSIVSFEYGTTLTYGQTITATQSPVTGNSNTRVTVDITGLTAGTTYHFRVKAENELGAAIGNDSTFTFRTSGIDKIDNITYFSTAYFNYGFSFSKAKLVSTYTNPGPDVVAYVNIDNLPYRLTLQAENLKPSFYKVGDFADEEAAQTAFNNLKTVSVSQWVDMADPLNINQVWIYRSGSDTYTKIRIISTVNEIRQTVNYGECTFQWVYQPNGSLTFPGN